MKKSSLLFWIVFLLSGFTATAQVTLDLCQEKARENYPLLRRAGLLEQSEQYTLQNAGKGYLPQVSVSARATWQSEVTKLPVSLPGMEIETLTRDQYQAIAEVNQVIWDGGVIRSREGLVKGSSELDRKRLEVDLYTLRERINQLFFGILLLQEQIKQNDLLQNELATQFKRVSALKENGMAQPSDLDALKVEQLKVEQAKTGLISTHNSFIAMLATMTGESIRNDALFVKPATSSAENSSECLRPEIDVFMAQNSLLTAEKDLLLAANRPKLGAFLQTGIGKPGLNMLKNDFSPFFLGGIRISWNLGNRYTIKNDLLKIDVNREMVKIQQETFLFNNKLAITQQNGELSKFREMLQRDEEIIKLRGNVKKAAETKVVNGTLSVSDLIREINAENMAIQERSLHEIQLLMSVYHLKNLTNN